MAPKIPAKKETIQYLYDSMGATIVDLSGELRAICLSSMEPNNNLKEKPLSQSLRDLHNGLFFICIDLCSLMRAEIRAKNNIEKRFYFKTIFSAIREGYVFVYGFNDGQRKRSLWNELSYDSRETQKQEYQRITDSLIAFGEKLEVHDIKNIRDISLHYNDCMVAVYNVTTSLSDEEDVALLICNFLAIIKDVLDYIRKSGIEQVNDDDINNSKSNIELPLNTAFGKAFLKNDVLVNAIDQNIKQASNRLDFFKSQYDKFNKLEHYLESAFEDSTIHDDFEPLDHVINVMMILDFMRAELGSLIISYLNSESEMEHKLLIRRIYVIKTSFLRHLYGYNDSEKTESIWNKIKASIPLNSTNLLPQYNAIAEKIKQEIHVEDRKLRALFVHFSERGKSNISRLISTLDYVNPVQVFQSACNLIKLCPLINSFILKLMESISAQQKEKTIEKRNMLDDNLFKIYSAVRALNINESAKKQYISSIKEMEAKFGQLLSK